MSDEGTILAQPACSPREAARLREIEARWYESYYSLIFTPPGEIPQTKGPWTEFRFVEEMIHGLRENYSQELPILVVGSRCGDITVETASEWLVALQVGMEWAEHEEAHVKAGVCADCGACSLKEAEKKCRPSPLGDSGDHTCDGERLWEKEREQEYDEENTEASDA